MRLTTETTRSLERQRDTSVTHLARAPGASLRHDVHVLRSYLRRYLAMRDCLRHKDGVVGFSGFQQLGEPDCQGSRTLLFGG